MRSQKFDFWPHIFDLRQHFLFYFIMLNGYVIMLICHCFFFIKTNFPFFLVDMVLHTIYRLPLLFAAQIFKWSLSRLSLRNYKFKRATGCSIVSIKLLTVLRRWCLPAHSPGFWPRRKSCPVRSHHSPGCRLSAGLTHGLLPLSAQSRNS